MKKIRNLILDMDGVLWRGDTPMPGLADFFESLDEYGIGYVLATNNASKTAAMYTEKLARFGVRVPPERILTSAEVTAVFLAETLAKGVPVYIVGAKGLHDALVKQGFRAVTPQEVRAGETAAAVVVGFSPHMTYEDVAMASLLVQKGVPFIATNPDTTFPSELGPLPGAGSIVALITTATGIEPTVIGKPGPIMFREAVKRLGGDSTHVAMVGDRLSTDIDGAMASGLTSILVLSGISTEEDVAASAVKPDFVFADIVELAEYLASEVAPAHD